MEAIVAIENKHRWFKDFVRKLGLCPWAGSSVDTIGAIRYWVLFVGCDDDDDDGDGGNDDGRGEAGPIGSGRGRRQRGRRPAAKDERCRRRQRETMVLDAMGGVVRDAQYFFHSG